MAEPVTIATGRLIERMDEFLADYRAELRNQESKKNLSSDARMRKLLRTFPARVYVPYRDESLAER